MVRSKNSGVLRYAGSPTPSFVEHGPYPGPVVENEDMPAKEDGLVKAVGDDDETESALRKDFQEPRLEPLPGDRVDGGEGLVEEEEARPQKDGPGKGHALALPPAQLRRIEVVEILDAQVFLDFPKLVVSYPPLLQPGAERDIRGHRLPRKESVMLQHETYALA